MRREEEAAVNHLVISRTLYLYDFSISIQFLEIFRLRMTCLGLFDALHAWDTR
jgi:hypothetical protein